MEKWEEVLQFWFGTPSGQPATDALPDAATRARWFASDPDFDALVRERFAQSLRQAAAGELDDWRQRAGSCLALIIVLDQFPRNIHRGTAQAFACDSLAREVCEQGLRKKLDRQLNPAERSFFYLPLEHAEDAAAQTRCVQLFQQMAAEVSSKYRELAEQSLDYAVQHRELILRFGRFPHRNEALQRASTPEERQFLTQAGSFGQ